MVPPLAQRAGITAAVNSLINQLTRRPLNHWRVVWIVQTRASFSVAANILVAGARARSSLPTVIYSHRHISATRQNPVPLSSPSPPNDSDQIILSKREGFLNIASTQEFLSQLTEAQKLILFKTLNLEIIKQKYENELGHYLTKFGRPTSIHHQDPTATFTPVPREWLHQKLVSTELETPALVEPILQDEKKCPPSLRDIWAVGLKNAIPFVGFGFLDNLIMIVAGDYIDTRIGAAFAISTMAAAALGNTISDVAGLASAWYVERVAEKVGIHQPELTAFQLASWQIRWVTNIGRAIGVTIGCLLGMIPLLFLNTKGDDGEDENSTSTNSSQKSEAKT